ncbi:MAG: hypothetical protein DCC68_22680 [Planctomycetota bacterium]|nr:MAG: hypothetical protein DCC68_22680 [Planctomycetota bacterium]
MNAYSKNSISFSAAIVAATLLFTNATTAFAQRDAGAKVRGESGSDFWSSKPRPRSIPRYSDEMRRSFSYEPAATPEATQSGASCHCGTTGPAASERAATQPQDVRRSFSYDPGYRSTRSKAAPRNEPWHYPKTDPRRYRP